jgi:L-fuculose-phosphate aldolase
MVELPANAQPVANALIDAGRVVVDRGLTLASGGNLSARVPDSDLFLMTGTGTWLDRLTLDDFALIDLEGNVVGGNPRPSVEWKLHHQSYLVRDDINSVIHVHPQTAVLLDAMGHAIRLITLDHAYYLKKVERIAFFPAGSHEVAVAAAEAARECNAVILGFHGSSTLGETVEMALRRALLLEEAALATFKTLQLGHGELTFPAEWKDRIVTI